MEETEKKVLTFAQKIEANYGNIPISKETILSSSSEEECERKFLTNKESEPINPENILAKELALIKKAAEFVKDPENNALGLAARQVGSPYSWFIMKFERDFDGLAVIINPEIIGRAERKSYIEGCFSESNSSKIKRAREITVNFEHLSLEDGTITTYRLLRIHGRDAQVFQHELHHLFGKLICDVGEEIKDAK